MEHYAHIKLTEDEHDKRYNFYLSSFGVRWWVVRGGKRSRRKTRRVNTKYSFEWMWSVNQLFIHTDV